MHRDSLAALAFNAIAGRRKPVSSTPLGELAEEIELGGEGEEALEGSDLTVKRCLLLAICTLWVGFQVYTALEGTFNLWIQRGVHLAFGVSLVFLFRQSGSSFASRAVDMVLALLTVGIFGYVAYENVDLTMRFPYVTPMPTFELVLGGIGILLVLEAARRTVGLTFTILAALFFAYLLVGQSIPGLLGHKGFSPPIAIEHIFFTSEGIFGVPVAVSSTYVFLFIMFGVTLESTGAGKFYLELVTGQVGHFRGGPAKVAVLSSAAMGTISGSAIANVVTTGTFTIPLMRRVGFSRNYAGGVESMASTGGQLTPPIMGVAAFIMSQFSGIPYAQIAWAAVLPAILYYSCGLWQIHFHALRKDVPTIPRNELPKFWPVFVRGWFFLPPLGVIIYLLLQGYTAISAALYGLLAILAGAILFGDRKLLTPLTLLTIFEKTAKAMLSVIGAVSAAGIIVGAMTLSGLGVNISALVVELASQSMLLALILTMVVATILGLGMPTSAAYIISAAVLVPSLIEIGVSILAAHFFALYFASLSVITPPVALASYAAASVSGGDPWKTGLYGFKLALAAYLVPFFFVYNEALLGQAEPARLILALVSGLIGTTALAAAIEGYALDQLNIVRRLIAAAGAILMVFPGWMTDIGGLVSILMSLAPYYRVRKMLGSGGRA